MGSEMCIRDRVAGVALALVGTVLTVLFGAQGGACHTIDQLVSFWSSWLWWLWLCATVSLALAAESLHTVWVRRRRRGVALPRSAGVVMPIAYTLASALLGGAQMIVHSKVFSILLSIIFAKGDFRPLASWLFYVEVVLVVV